MIVEKAKDYSLTYVQPEFVALIVSEIFYFTYRGWKTSKLVVQQQMRVETK